ncbi:hypothetical protein EV360DRAFT_75126 [Lentinula raphanica]|nr:hypothetical protein EV360DRAFT_75126 [Lentinula raphanica]
MSGQSHHSDDNLYPTSSAPLEQTNSSSKLTSPLLHQTDCTSLKRDHLVAFKNFILIEIGLPKILLNAGILSYLMFTLKMLWKFMAMFRSHLYSIGFILPSVAAYAFVQRYSPGKPNPEIVSLVHTLLGLNR